MNRVARNTLATLERVQQFLAQHPMVDAPAMLGAQATELNDVIAALSGASVDQEAGERFLKVHTASQRALREELYAKHMRPVSFVAREVFGVTGMDRAFRLPPTNRVTSTVLTAASAMIEAADASHDVFVQHGLAQDFVEQFRAAAAAVTQSVESQTASGRRRVMATAAAKDLVKRGRKAVRLLDAILVPRFSADPDLLAAWQSAKKVRPAASPAAPAPSTTPAVDATSSVTTEKAA